MDENNKEMDSRREENYSNTGWHLVKFALLLVAVFLATYLAIYYITDQIRDSYYKPSIPIEEIDKIMREQDKMFNQDTAMPMQDFTQKSMNSPVETYKDKNTDSYKMIIDLKAFQNNPNNVDLKVKDNTVSVRGLSDKSDKNSEKIYAFSQIYTLPQKIDEDKITKEHVKNKYIITLPIDIDD